MSSVSFVVREPIRTVASTGVVTVDGARIGSLATHPSLNQRNLDGSPIWTITHVPSGMRMGSDTGFLSEAQALDFIKALNALPFDWTDSRNLRKDAGMHAAFESLAYVCGGVVLATEDAESPT
ncbi:hypothetical protein [Mesorhizobium sp. M0520]|uniref:hypothetical protein n=1 Tax=Mesorhizobium sp. M0520 TaxID=2956957 RepID=UPI00333A6E18